MQLLITPLAAVDLEEISDYIAQDNPIVAGTFVAELRSCAHGNYVIFFEYTTEKVTIVRILHGARDIPVVLKPR